MNMMLFVALCVTIITITNVNNFIEPYLYNGDKTIIEICLMILFAIVIAFRPEEVKDTQNYIYIFENMDYIIHSLNFKGFFSKYQGMEYGFILICYFFKSIFNNYRVMFFAIALFNIYFSVFFLSRLQTNITQSKSMIISSYMTSFGILYCGIAIRSGIAITLGLGAVYYFKNKNFLRAFIMIFAGVMVQRSSIIYVLFMIIFYLSQNSKLTINSHKLMGLSVLGIFFLMTNMGNYIFISLEDIFLKVLLFLNFGGYYKSYLADNYDGSIGIIDVLVTLCIILIFVTICNSRIITNNGLIYMLVIVMCAIIFLHGIRAVSRIYDMALIFYIAIINPIFQDAYKRCDLKIILIIFCIQGIFLLISFRICFL